MLNTGSSAWGVRPRMAIYAKGGELQRSVELIKPSGPLNNPVFTDEFKFGRVPTLWIGRDRILQESEAIMDYFEDLQPEPSLRPKDIFEKATMRMLIGLADGSVLRHLTVLFANRNPRTRDPVACGKALVGLNDGYDRLEYFLAGPRYAVANMLTQADCTIVPALWLTLDFLPFFDAPSVLDERRPKLVRYWDEVRQDPVVARIVAEMAEHLGAARAARIAAEAAEQAAFVEPAYEGE